MSAPKFDLGAILNMSGFAEAAAALYVAGAATEVPAAMRAQLDLVVNNRASELQKAIDAAVSDITARAGSFLNDPNIQQAIGSLQTSASQSDLMSRIASAQRDLDRAQDRAQDVNDVETPEQHISRLWAQIDEADRDLNKQFDLYATEEEKRARADNARDVATWRDRVQNASTPEERRDAQAGLATAVDKQETTDVNIAGRIEGEHGPAAAAPIYRSIGARKTAYDDLTAAYGERDNRPDVANSTRTENTTTRDQQPATMRETFDAMADINIAPAATTPQTGAAVQPAAAPVELLRYEATDVALGDTGQFTPASASQPGVPTGGRTV